MIDHVILNVADLKRSVWFYEQALRPLGITDCLNFPGEDSHPHL
jgi:catechol 2,3-dioxygenase-like lactoylglutathione lyase family enzyme